jgi:hypothetical protein
MQAEPLFDFPTLVAELNARGTRFLLIGRQALVLHGAPVYSFDYDLWVDGAERQRVLRFLLVEKGFEGSATIDDPRPLVSVYAGQEKLDLFFHRAVRTHDGVDLDFDTAWRDAVEVVDDTVPGFRVRIPSLDHMILLKKLRPRNAKDEEDLKYLLAKKAEE